MALTKLLDEKEKIVVGRELVRLFALQDKTLSTDKEKALVVEIERIGAPVDAVLRGINELCGVDMKTIKFFDIKDAIDKHWKIRLPKVNCMHCEGRGLVSMVDSQSRNYSFACFCTAGQPFAAKMHVWNGAPRQMIASNEFLRYEFFLLGERQYLDIYGRVVA